MVLPLESQKRRLGLQESVSLSDIPKLLQDMIKQSSKIFMEGLEVEVFVTGGTSELPLAVSWQLKEVTS